MGQVSSCWNLGSSFLTSDIGDWQIATVPFGALEMFSELFELDVSDLGSSIAVTWVSCELSVLCDVALWLCEIVRAVSSRSNSGHSSECWQTVIVEKNSYFWIQIRLSKNLEHGKCLITNGKKINKWVTLSLDFVTVIFDVPVDSLISSSLHACSPWTVLFPFSEPFFLFLHFLALFRTKRKKLPK